MRALALGLTTAFASLLAQTAAGAPVPRCASGDARASAGACCPRGTDWSAALDRCAAVAEMARACDGGNVQACLDESRVALAQGQSTRAVERSRRACEDGVPLGCARLGLLTAEGRGVRRDRQRGAHLLERACGQWVASACTWRAELAARSGERPLAMRFFRRGCDGGDPAGCRRAAELLGGEGAYAVELLRRGCTRGELFACAAYGRRTRDVTQLTRACNGGVLVACADLAGLVRDPRAAEELDQRACRGGLADACVDLVRRRRLRKAPGDEEALLSPSLVMAARPCVQRPSGGGEACRACRDFAARNRDLIGAVRAGDLSRRCSAR